MGKWHVGLTFFDSDGQPINQNGLEAVKRIDYSRPIVGGPLDHGFDYFFGTACCPTTDWLYAYIDGKRVPVPPTDLLDRSHLPQHPYSRDNRRGMIAPDFDLEEVDLVFLEKSRHFLKEHVTNRPDQPFFLYHCTQAVHLPSFAAKPFQGKSGAGPHGDFILELDYIVGQLCETLERLKVADNTLVIFTSDNGPEVTTVLHMRADHGHDGARPWRGMKRDNWEGGHRVPFIARWPGRIKPGTTSDETICLTDLMATCASVVGTSLPAGAAEDSYDILPALLGKSQSAPVHPYVLHQTISLAMGIRNGPWKLLDHQGSGGNRYKGNPRLEPLLVPDTDPAAPGQLYHLDEDPYEQNNLYSKYPERVSELKRRLEQYKQSGRSAPPR